MLVLFAALPTASAAHVLAAGFGANRELVATLIAQTTLLAAADPAAVDSAVELAFWTPETSAMLRRVSTSD